ncbi:hypothetical protein NPIL_71351, partial [Nephila pilipes]
DCVTDANSKKILNNCRRNCKVSCKKLIYRYEIIDRVLDILPNTASAYKIFKDTISIRVSIASPEVIVMSHKPLYTVSIAFSCKGQEIV